MKALLVIDMPNDCGECPLNSHTEYDFDVCWVTQGKGGCPLKHLPKKEENPIKGEDDYNDFCIGYTRGWNDCLEEIQNDN